MSNQVKLSSFYGGQVARPYLVFDAAGQAVKDRVDAPSVNESLLSWAAKVPFEAGGSLMKPQTWAGELPAKPRTDFQIFCDTRRMDIIAANPSLLVDHDDKIFRSGAQFYWAEKLTGKERYEFKQAAEAERQAVDAALAALEIKYPEFKQYKERQETYARVKKSIASAHRIAAGPLSRAARALHTAALETKTDHDGSKGKKKSKTQREQRRQRTVSLPRLRVIVNDKQPKEVLVRSKLYAANHVQRMAPAQTMSVVENATEEISAPEITQMQKGKKRQSGEEYSGTFALPESPEKRVTRSKAADAAPVAKRLRKSRK